eukprot:TRINITY_DN65234_c0_g1_i1.p2 TRINITY_DN65234_c0_g1~~TRINITY_DN65234_c0_g1_i1.p2  ORF type:complete len:169 (+),score=65.38 TRINITY_DN65234_c0_g1_i1:89-595(+)
MADTASREVFNKIPQLKTRAGPRDGELWTQRLKEELACLISFIELNKEQDCHWCTLQSNDQGTKWTGKVWHYHQQVKYEFDLVFEIPVGYPQAAPELALPELEGKTLKMYRGGKICLTQHFQPLWARNVPHFGIAHALSLGMGPWLAAEVPHMVREGYLKPPEAVPKS